jgi:hypothetical protein
MLSPSFKYGSLIPAKRAKIIKTNHQRNKSMGARSHIQSTDCRPSLQVNQLRGGGVSETCAVYCELGLHACPPLAPAINMPHSEMCTQQMLDRVNRFRIAPTESCLHHFGNSRRSALGNNDLGQC